MKNLHYILALVLALGAAGPLYAGLATPAGSKAVLGRFDGTEADSAGEVSYKLGGMITGMPADSLAASDTVVVETVYAVSSLDSVPVADSLGVKSGDTVDFRCWVQNQGNLVSDSLVIAAGLADTANPGHFAPTYFRLLDQYHVERGVDLGVDTAWCGVRLAEGGIDTFSVRVAVPGPLEAADNESLDIQILVRDRNGLGANDSWPGGRAVIDTSHTALYTRGDTLQDYGDTQVKTVHLKVSNPALYLKSAVNKVSTAPGDTLGYNLVYDNDGSGATQGAVSIQQLLPKYVRYLPGSAAGAYHTGESGTQINFSTLANRTAFTMNTTWANSTPDSVAGIKWTFVQPIGADDLDDTKGAADDSTAGVDGGRVEFRVIVK
jgi:hypothetical protein